MASPYEMPKEKFEPLYLLITWVHQNASFLNISGVYRASRQYKNIYPEPFVTEVIRAERVA